VLNSSLDTPQQGARSRVTAKATSPPPPKTRNPDIDSAGGLPKSSTPLYLSSDQEPPDAQHMARENLEESDRHFWYNFIGECYLHSMMDGEAINYQDRNGIEPTIFELR
jgi:hypothetical protein